MKGLVFALAVALAALLTYSQFFGMQLAEFDFVTKLVSHSGTGLDNILGIFTQPDHFYMTGYMGYRPMTGLVWWAVFILGGFNMVAFHALNFTLHAVNGVLVFILARKLMANNDRKGWYSLLAGLIFVVNPTHINTVVFASRLPELLVAFFMLAALLSLMKYLEGGRKPYLLASFLFSSAGIFSKEIGSLIPFVLFIYLVIFTKQRKPRKRLYDAFRVCLPYFAVIPAYIAMMLISTGRIGVYSTMPQWMPDLVVIEFFKYLLYPASFLGDGAFLWLRAFLSAMGGVALFIAAILIAAYAARKLSGDEKSRPIAFALCWLLAFMLAFVAVGYLAPWYAYAAVVPFSLLISMALRRWLGSGGISPKLGVILVFVLAITIALFSPIMMDYPQARKAGDMVQSIYSQTLEKAGNLPDGSLIFLVNYPEYMKYSVNGFNNSVIMLNEASVQAMLDFACPRKGLESFSLVSSLILADPEGLRMGYKENGCALIATNSDTGTARIYPPYKWKGERNETKGIMLHPSRGVSSEEIAIEFPEGIEAFAFIFDGKDIHSFGISGSCDWHNSTA